jgi:hypothetical protein
MGYWLLHPPEQAKPAGFSITAVSFFISYNFFSKKKRKMIYCTRKEIEKNFIIRQLEVFSKNKLDLKFGFNLSAIPSVLGLFDKKELCIDPRIKSSSKLDEIEDFCLSLITFDVFLIKENEKYFLDKKTDQNSMFISNSYCKFFLNFKKEKENFLTKDIWSIDRLRSYGIKKGFCPFFFFSKFIVISRDNNLFKLSIIFFQFL